MLTLIIGNKNYSSWSLRAWLGLKFSGLDFEEVLIPLDTDSFADDIAEYSDAARVPVLLVNGQSVWDSLAILETIAELAPDVRLWPENSAERARARAISAEMHSGFEALRMTMPMNMHRKLDAFSPAPDAQQDIDRICDIWRDCLDTSGGPWLFDEPTIADAMYAPVASRFRTYAIPMDDACSAYVNTVFAHPAMQSWNAAADTETWIHPDVEAVT